jgi:hypothetical protein
MALAAVLAALEADPSVLLAATRDRIGGSRIAALREYLHAYSNGRCVVCLLPTRLDANANDSDRAEIGHLINASSIAISASRCGFVPGNVATMCHACNSNAGDYTFRECDIKADLVPLTWPILKKQSARIDEHSMRAREIREANGLPF